MKITADTNVLIRAMTGDDLRQSKLAQDELASADSVALRAVLIGSAVYMAFTLAFDIHWTLIGMLEPIAWFSIALRFLLVCGYLYYIPKHRTPA